MSNAQGTIEVLAQELIKLLQPLKDDLAPQRARVLFAELGLATTQAHILALSTPLKITADNTLRLVQSAEELVAAIKAENVEDVVEKGIEIINLAKNIIESFADIRDGISGLGLAGVTPDILNTIPENLFNYLLLRYLERMQGVTPVISFLGVLEQTEQNIGSADPDKPPFTRSKFNFNKISTWLSNPGSELVSLYKWGDPAFDGRALFASIEDVLSRQAIPVIYDDTDAVPKLDLVILEAIPKTDINPKGLVFKIKNELNSDFNIEEDDYKLNFNLGFNPPINTELLVQPNGNVAFTPPSLTPLTGSVLFDLLVKKKPDPNLIPYVIIGEAGSSRLEFVEFNLKSGARLSWQDSAAAGSFFIEAQARGGKLLIDTKNGDGFLSKLLPLSFESDFDLGLGFSTDSGVFIIGSSTIEIILPTHVELGPISIDALTIALKLKEGVFIVGLGANIKASLGPLDLVIENIGLQSNLSFPPNNSGNLGPLDLSLGFKPPNGLGLSLDTGIIKGGGYLYFDTDREEYAGALELIFSNWIALKAIGLITTKMPDGSKGFSMVILITAEFSGGLQLGFGFTLLGVGGLLGLNRIVNADALREGIKNGNVNSIMFPTDVIANAPKILSDMKAFFPLHEGQFLIGPMAKIGYGTPTLISISLGVIIEFPDVNITILGVVKVGLPTEEAAVLKLNVNFMGRIEPSNNQLWFYAALYDSRILFITLEGEMGLLVNWGDNANFVFTVGGFHPKYSVPSLPFSISKRLAVNILNESFARIRVEAYFAVTSNTVQLGARAELFFGCDAFSIDGHLGFDILFQFNPFYFSFELSVSLGVKLFGMGLFSVGFSGLIEGPTPWHIKGHGSIGFLFFDVSIPFEHTWGETQNEILPSITILPLLKSELENEANWKVKLPARESLLVTVKKLEVNEDNALLIHSTGTLQLSQRKAPLKLVLDKYGNQAPGDVNNLDFAITAGSTALSSNVLFEKFATGEFKKLSETDKITKPGFESYKGGLEVFPANGNYNTFQAIQRNIRYETIIIDSNYKRHQNKFYNLFASLGIFNNFLHSHWIKGAVVTKSPLAQKQTEYLKPIDVAISINDIKYAIVNADDLTMVQNTPIFNSRFLAEQSLNTITGHSSSLNASYIIIPSSEILEI